MPIEPVKIPQNVYIEDRIVGPVTLRQLIILLITGGFSYAIWTGVKNQLGFSSIPVTIVCWIPFVVGAAFAFIRIQQISLLRFILLMTEKTEKPQIRTWMPRRGISINFRYFSQAAEAAEKAKQKKIAAQPHREKLEELSALLDQGPIVTAPHAAPLSETSEEEPARRPVDPGRVRASTQEESRVLEDILERTDPSHPAAVTAPSPTSTLRDLLPPAASHAS